MSAVDDFRHYLAECPLIAIIRGVTPDDAETTARAIHEGGKETPSRTRTRIGQVRSALCK